MAGHARLVISGRVQSLQRAAGCSVPCSALPRDPPPCSLHPAGPEPLGDGGSRGQQGVRLAGLVLVLVLAWTRGAGVGVVLGRSLLQRGSEEGWEARRRCGDRRRRRTALLHDVGRCGAARASHCVGLRAWSCSCFNGASGAQWLAVRGWLSADRRDARVYLHVPAINMGSRGAQGGQGCNHGSVPGP